MPRKLCGLIILLSSFPCFGVLPELLTKQSLDNIRYISDDGKTTYFQKRSGSLHLTYLFNTYDLLSLPANTQYTLKVTSHKKKVLVSAYKNYLTNHAFNAEADVYVGEFNSKNLSLIGKGTKATLHLLDNWVSFYHPKSKEIELKEIGNDKNSFTVKLKNKVNPYFEPLVLMTNEQTIVYTDLTSEGYTIAYKIDRRDGQIVALIRTNYPGMKIEMCLKDKKIYWGQFSLGDTAHGSGIFVTEIDSLMKLNKQDLIYSSPRNDLGHIICETNDEKLYFISATNKESEINIKSTEATEIDLKTKEVKVLSQIGDATQLIRLDNRVLIPYRGKLLVVKGEANLKSDDLIQKSVKPTAAPITEETIFGSDE